MDIATHVRKLKSAQAKLVGELSGINNELEAIKSALSGNGGAPVRASRAAPKPRTPRTIPLDGQTCNQIVTLLESADTPLTRQEIESKLGVTTAGIYLTLLAERGRIVQEKPPYRGGRNGRTPYLYSAVTTREVQPA